MFRRKKKIKEIKKPNCMKDGHDYKVVEQIKIIDTKEDLKKPIGISTLLECKNCDKRKQVISDYGTGNQLTEMWLDGQISLEKKKELQELQYEEYEEYQKEFVKNKSKKKTKKRKKKNAK